MENNINSKAKEKKLFFSFKKNSDDSKKTVKKKRKKLYIISSCIAIVFVIAFSAFVFLLPSRRAQAASYGQSTVQTGSIVKTVAGTGNLTHGDTANINIPSGIEIEEMLVSLGDYVEEGQGLATVNIITVKTTLADVQSQLDEIDSQINSVKSDSESNVITSNYSGRVKKIYAEEGKEANDIMTEHGALMLISIDGKMAVDFETDISLSQGSSVTVELANGTKKTGTVLRHTGNTYTVTISDYGADIDEEVTISKSGTALGTGKLYINKPITIAGSGSTINTIHVIEDSSISVGTKLITLDDTVVSSEYLQLEGERKELMEQYNALVSMSAGGNITAPQSGTIASVNVSAGTVSSGSGSSSASSSQSQQSSAGTQQESSSADSTSSSSGSVTAFTIATDKEMTLEISIDEMDILSVEKGMEVSVTFDAIEGKTYSGTISRVSNSASTSSGSAKYTAEILLTADENMRAGMNATATITIEKKENILTIPVGAIQERGNRVFVYTQTDSESGTLSGEKEITTGISDGQTAEVLSGLSEGETVYYTVSSSDNSEETGFMFGGMGGMRGNMQGGSMNRSEMPNGDERPSMPGGEQ